MSADSKSYNEIKRIPDRFVDAVDQKILRNIILQLPNGRELHLHYNSLVKSLTHLDPLYTELRRHLGFYVIFSYKGMGVFSIHVFSMDGTEVVYERTRRIARAPVTVQDTVGGKRWKFMLFALGSIFHDGSITIPESFLEKFRTVIEESVTVVLVNGEVVHCTYAMNDGKISGLFPIVHKHYITNRDTLLFTCLGKDRFDLSILDHSRTEKMLPIDVIDIESDSEDVPECVDGVLIEPDIEANAEHIDHGDEIGIEFSRVLSWSHVNGSSHGVHIPVHVKPSYREWVAGEVVTLRNLEGAWRVVIVKDGKKSRFSGGWNKFSSDNELYQDQTLSLRMVEEIDGIVFIVE